MNAAKEKELQENLEFLRGQFDVLNQDIKLPHSLQPDMLRYKLENLDALEEKPQKRRYWRAFAAVAACFVVVCGTVWMMGGPGTDVSSGLEAQPQLARSMEYVQEDATDQAAGFSAPAAFQLESESGEAAFSGDVEAEASTEETMALQSPVADRGEKIRSQTQIESLEKARGVLPWGVCLPQSAPEGTAYTVGETDGNGLYVWFGDAGYTRELRIAVRSYTEDQSICLADPARPETFDLRQYEIPYADTTPEEYFYTLQSPIFRAEEISEEILEARLLPSEELGDEKAYYGNLSVLYAGNLVAEYHVMNLSPQELYQIILETQTAVQ